MDDQTNQGMPASPNSGLGEPGMPIVPDPSQGGMGTVPPPPPPVGGMGGEDPHEKIMASLARIEEKLAAISAKLGA